MEILHEQRFGPDEYWGRVLHQLFKGTEQALSSLLN